MVVLGWTTYSRWIFFLYFRSNSPYAFLQQQANIQRLNFKQMYYNFNDVDSKFISHTTRKERRSAWHAHVCISCMAIDIVRVTTVEKSMYTYTAYYILNYSVILISMWMTAENYLLLSYAKELTVFCTCIIFIRIYNILCSFVCYLLRLLYVTTVPYI